MECFASVRGAACVRRKQEGRCEQTTTGGWRGGEGGDGGKQEGEEEGDDDEEETTYPQGSCGGDVRDHDHDLGVPLRLLRVGLYSVKRLVYRVEVTVARNE